MGQKVHPIGFRLGIATEWTSRWYANSRDYPEFLETDLRVREYIKKRLANASVSRVVIARAARNVQIRTAMTNSFGFGGHTVSVVFGAMGSE